MDKSEIALKANASLERFGKLIVHSDLNQSAVFFAQRCGADMTRQQLYYIGGNPEKARALPDGAIVFRVASWGHLSPAYLHNCEYLDWLEDQGRIEQVFVSTDEVV